MSIKHFVKAARLRTLPLAVAGALSGNLMAYAEYDILNINIMILIVLTAVMLQILSNFANDYGDFKNGADEGWRADRMMASGKIKESHMVKAIITLIILCFLSGITLLYVAFNGLTTKFWIFLLIGIAGIAAAYYYTAGKKPYGYVGLGDISVFIFFGLVSVMGSFYLQCQRLDNATWWVAAGIGFLCVAVLNINNIRDITADRIMGKITIPVRLGYNWAMLYHFLLLFCAIGSFAAYNSVRDVYQALLISGIFGSLFSAHFKYLFLSKTREAYNKQLKALSMLTLVLSLYFCFIAII